MGVSVFFTLQSFTGNFEACVQKVSETVGIYPCGKSPCFSLAARASSLPDSRIKSDNGKGRIYRRMAEKREPQLCIRKKYFMAFFVKRFYSLRISETGKDIFDGKKEKAERNPL
jgi:hypothetical protein